MVKTRIVGLSASDGTTSLYKKKLSSSVFEIFNSLHVQKINEHPKIYCILVVKYMTSAFETQTQNDA